MARPKNQAEDKVRDEVIKELIKRGWEKEQLKKEWTVPDTPHDLSKREKGQQFSRCGRADLAIFADDSQEAHALLVICEFKAPNRTEGREQLRRYLASEPVVKMGYWTNGTDSLAIYKNHSSDWIEIKGVAIPKPGDDFTRPPQKPLTWETLERPTSAQLTAILRRLVATTVTSDTISTRREDQIKELLHLLLVKIESDSWASNPAHVELPVHFRIYGDVATMTRETASQIKKQFGEYFARQQNRVFDEHDTDQIRLSDETILSVVDTLSGVRILGDEVDILSKAFQVFRTKAMKSGEGQFLTPLQIIRPCVEIMEITSSDKIIDPACGSGGFLIEALRQVRNNEFSKGGEDTWRLVKFANDNLYGVDKDRLGLKLTKSMMIAMQDGSTHCLCGDMVRQHLWREKFPSLFSNLSDRQKNRLNESFTVVITNPPFGQDLKVSASDCQKSHYSISIAAAAAVSAGSGNYTDLEIGLVYLEVAHRILQGGGRLGIILPETYFFSYSYRWLPGWLENHYKLRGMLNIPMEAFEEFCRAKTNFYIFEKI